MMMIIMILVFEFLMKNDTFLSKLDVAVSQSKSFEDTIFTPSMYLHIFSAVFHLCAYLCPCQQQYGLLSCHCTCRAAASGFSAYSVPAFRSYILCHVSEKSRWTLSLLGRHISQNCSLG